MGSTSIFYIREDILCLLTKYLSMARRALWFLDEGLLKPKD